MSMHQGSLNTRLRDVFSNGLLYTVDQLSEITGEKPERIRTQISRLRKKIYCGKSEPLDMVQDLSKIDNKRRWGLRGSKRYANVGKLK
jgi:hypothetical protein